jgi:nucleoside-triphosphatase
MPNASTAAQRLRLVLEGPPKVGKTTVVERLVALLRDAGESVGGFITREVRGADGRRVGFKVRDLTGAEAWLAHQDFDTAIRVGRFGVDVASFEQVGVAALRKTRDRASVVIIDEVARMELASDAFVQALDEILRNPQTVVATVHVYEHPVTNALKQRTDINLIAVTESNRDNLPVQLFRRLRDSAAADDSA